MGKPQKYIIVRMNVASSMSSATVMTLLRRSVIDRLVLGRELGSLSLRPYNKRCMLATTCSALSRDDVTRKQLFVLLA